MKIITKFREISHHPEYMEVQKHTEFRLDVIPWKPKSWVIIDVQDNFFAYYFLKVQFTLFSKDKKS